MFGDELFARLNGFIREAVNAAAIPNLEFTPGDFAIPQEAPSVHTAPSDFTFAVGDTPGFSQMSVEQKMTRSPTGSVSGTFSVLFAGADYAEVIALRDVVMGGVRSFLLDLRKRKQPVYGEIESIGRPDADLPDNTPFVREVRVAVEFRADNLWR